jgi:hypothetical protein
VTDDAFVHDPDRVVGVFKTNTLNIVVSRELALDMGLVEPTPEEVAARAAQAEAFRREEAAARTKPGPALTLESLLAYLEWPAEFAEHVLHPACSCTPEDHDDPHVCAWGRELGWTHDYEKGFHRASD